MNSVIDFKHNRPLIMGILNVTPDSFSDGARFNQQDKALQHAEQMLAEGADIIDIGGESTRPGAQAVSEADELARVIPLIKTLERLGARVSVDTSKPVVMQAALDAGVHMINDVCALQAPGALEIVGRYPVAVCLMHMQGEPRTMQRSPEYTDVVMQVKNFLQVRIDACLQAGIARSSISIDPGFGFGKTLAHNLELLRELATFKQLEVAVLAGISRKSMLGQITGRDVGDRLAASLAAAMIAIQRGADIIRVHDVKQTADIKAVCLAVENPIQKS